MYRHVRHTGGHVCLGMPELLLVLTLIVWIALLRWAHWCVATRDEKQGMGGCRDLSSPPRSCGVPDRAWNSCTMSADDSL